MIRTISLLIIFKFYAKIIMNGGSMNINNFNPDFKSIIGYNIKYYRKKRNMRLMDLAEKLNVSVEYLKRIESPNDKKKNCSLTLLYKISLILNYKLDDFLIDHRP